MRGHICLVLAFLGGCDAGIGNESDRRPEKRDYIQEVQALPTGQRKAVFLRVIQDAGIDCQGVTEDTLLQGRPVQWRVRCIDGRYHLISLNRDGTALVVSGRDR